MSFTVQNTYDAIRRRLQDYSDESYSDDELLLYINDAQKDFSVTGCCQGKDNVSFSAASSATYAAAIASNSDAADIIELLRVDIGALPLPTSPMYEEIDWQSPSTGTPTGWTHWGETVYLNASYTGTVYFWYTFTPVELTLATDSLILPIQWFPAIVTFACYKCLDSSQDQQAQALLSEYMTQKIQSGVMYGRREDQPKPVVE